MTDFHIRLMSLQHKHNRAVFCQNHSRALLPVVFLAEGRPRLPRWFFSDSTSSAASGPLIQTRADHMAGFDWSRRRTFQQTWKNK